MSTQIRMQADDFFNAYLALYKNVGMSTNPTMVAGIVCLAFSVELYIKDLHFAINSKTTKDHDILKLFEELPESIRQDIFSHDAISQNSFIARGDPLSFKGYSAGYTAYDGFIDNIKLISEGFIKWRYSYESTTLKYNSWFAIALIESIRSVADVVRQRSQKHLP